jgi:hypothetical protein
VVFWLEVDARQYRARPHPPEQPDAGCAAARADLDHGLRADGGGQEAQHHARHRRYRHRAAHCIGVRAGRQERLVLADEFVEDSGDV